MSPDQIDTAIAEWRGWTRITSVLESARLWGKRPDSRDDGFNIGAVPQYHRCLNAMAEAEAFLRKDDPHAYACYCSDFMEEYGSESMSLGANERSKHFLEVIGKYQPA